MHLIRLMHYLFWSSFKKKGITGNGIIEVLVIAIAFSEAVAEN